MSGSLSGQVAIITGAGSGIGAEVARALSTAGARVVLCGRRLENLEQVAAGLSGESSCVACDVKVEVQMGEVIEKTAARFGRIDILVYSAGIFDLRPLIDTSAEFFDDVISTNLRGAFLMAKAAWPHLKASQGQIVNIASVAGTRGFANCSAYCSSKFGLNGLSEALALEGKAHGIRVFAVCPGAVDTALWEGTRGQGTEGQRESVGMKKERNPIADPSERSRMMGPEPVADLIRWLVTSDRRLDVGRVVVVNFNDPWGG